MAQQIQEAAALNMQTSALSADKLANTIIPGIPNGVTREENFDAAFKKARKALGPGMIFMYKLQGDPAFKRYTTDFKEEVEREDMQEGGDVNMLPNVASAPMMEGTPMGGNLSEPMAPAQAELDPAEVQEAQGALMQIIQIIQMLINQGMSEEEIQQFLAQYGITEEELDQAAAILGVDIDALIAGEQRMPMAQGMSADLQKFMAQIASNPQRQQRSMMGLQKEIDPNPRPDFPLGNIDALKFEIAKLERAYQNALDNNNFVEAQRIANEIDKAQQDIIENQDKLPLSQQAAAIEGFNMPMPVAGLNMRFGGSAAGK